MGLGRSDEAAQVFVLTSTCPRSARGSRGGPNATPNPCVVSCERRRHITVSEIKGCSIVDWCMRAGTARRRQLATLAGAGSPPSRAHKSYYVVSYHTSPKSDETVRVCIIYWSRDRYGSGITCKCGILLYIVISNGLRDSCRGYYAGQLHALQV